MQTLVDFFLHNTPPLLVIATAGPLGLLWAAAGLTIAGFCKSHLGWRTGYTRKLFHFHIFSSVAFLAWRWGTPQVCLFGGMTTLVVFYAVMRGDGYFLYEAIAREKDAPHRSYFVVAPYFATLIGGLAANILFAQGAIVGYLVTGIGDAIAEPIGTRFGRHPYRVPSAWGVPATRTIEGSIAVLAASLIAAVIGLLLSPALAASDSNLWKLPLFAVCCAVLEAVSPHGWDNAVLQIIPAALALWWFGAAL